MTTLLSPSHESTPLQHSLTFDSANGMKYYWNNSEDIDQISSPEDMEQIENLGVSSEVYYRHQGILRVIDDIHENLPESSLSDAVRTAIKAKATDVLAAIKVRETDESYSFSVAEAERAQRDLDFMLSSMAVALGAYDGQEGIEKRATAVWPVSARHLNRGRYESIYTVRTETWNDEGDFNDVTGDDRDMIFEDGFGYHGRLTVSIDPARRIEFSYMPDQENARSYHTSQTVVSNGESDKVFHDTALSLRIDIDPHAPAGIALDVGRSKFTSDKISRPGDLLGKVLLAVSPDGSHEYEGFTHDMVEKFPGFAEEMALQQHLCQRWLGDDRSNLLTARQWDAQFERYVSNNPQ